MADILLPPWLHIARLRTSYIDSTGISVGEFTGAKITGSRGGDRLAASLEFSPTASTSAQSAMERAAVRSFLTRLRGRQNRGLVFDPSNRIRGSFPAAELISNNTFANGTTGFASGSDYSGTVSDRVYRAVRVAMSGSAIALRQSATVSVTQYAPYVARFFIDQGRGAYTNFRIDAGSTAGGSEHVQGATQSGYGLKSQVFIPSTTAAAITLWDLIGSSGLIAGDYISIPYVSLSRVALVDNGINLLTYSDDVSNAAWTKTNLTVTGSQTAPDGTSTAALLTDTAVNDFHLISQNVTVSSSAADYAFSVAAKAGTAVSIILNLISTTQAQVTFTLATGAVGATSAGADWANVRGFSTSIGGGWYIFTVVARKIGSGTTVSARSFMNSTGQYLGTGQTMTVWRSTLAPSSVPTRLIQTTATAASSGTSQTGSALYTKGWPASTNGLLLPDDRFEVITSRGNEFKIVTAAVNSDSAGRAYIQFEPPLRGTPADNAPIIVHQPFMRGLFVGDIVGWDDAPGIITTASAEFEETA